MKQTDQICNMSGLNRDLKGLMSWYMIIFFQHCTFIEINVLGLLYMKRKC